MADGSRSVVRSRAIAAVLCAGALAGGIASSSATGAAADPYVFHDLPANPSFAPGVQLPGTDSRATEAGLSTRLAELSKQSLAAQPDGEQADAVSLPGVGPGSLLRDGDRLIVNARVTSTGDEVLAGIRDAGAEIVSVNGRYGTVDLAILPGDLRALADVDGVEYVGENLAPMSGSIESDSGGTGARLSAGDAAKKGACFGAATAEGDLQSGSAAARQAFGVDGNGETVGIISDSFDAGQSTITRAAQGIASGDLPGKRNPCGYKSGVQVLAEGAASDTDEGRAMAEIVHDMAPGARIAFATRGASEDDMAGAVRALRAAGATVIVDDVTFFDEPMFQEGPIANAVSEVTAAGVPYYSSAANSNLIVAGQNVGSFEAPSFRPGGTCLSASGLPGQCMDFNPGPAIDVGYELTIAPGSSFTTIMNWAEPRNGVATDFDVLAFDEFANNFSSVAGTNNIQSQKPFETLRIENPYPFAAIFDLVIYRASGAAFPRLKFIIGRARLDDVEYRVGLGSDVIGPTIMGHNGSANTISTAAISYDSSTAPQTYSSRGPTVNYFAPVSGTTPAPALPIPQVLAKPDITATDNIQNTFFGGGVTGVPRFGGTSAAAPAAAAVAALQLNANPFLTPAEVLAAEKGTAGPIGFFGPSAIGGGLINGQGAVSVHPPLRPETTITKGPGKTVRGSRAKYKFESNLRGAKFQCGVGRRSKFRACSSPVRVVGIRRGSKTTFQVRAINGKAKDKSPAKDSFRRP